MEDSELGRILEKMRLGREVSAAELLPHVNSALREIARRQMSAQSSGHTLQPTALVNEAYVRLFPSGVGRWRDKAHFLAVAATAMRHILVDHARRRRAAKRAHEREWLDDIVDSYGQHGPDLLVVDDALEALAEVDPRMARLVELRFIAGYSIEETAQILGCSTATAGRRWRVASAWLRKRFGSEGTRSESGQEPPQSRRIAE